MAKVLTLLVLRLLMNLLLIGWISLWIIKPTTLWIQSWRQAEDTAKHTFFGYYGKPSNKPQTFSYCTSI